MNIDDETKAIEVAFQEIQRDAVALATLLDEMIGYIPLSTWPQLHKDLEAQGWDKSLLKDLRDKYADRYRNV